MRKKTAFYITLGVCWALSIALCAAQTPSIGLMPGPGVLVSSNNPRQNLETLVNIKAVDAPEFRTENGKLGVASVERFGQGMIIDSHGIIATNRHIIGNARHIYAILSGGRMFEANVLRNSRADLCLIKINAPFPLRSIALADPSEIQIGNSVTAVTHTGSPKRKLDGQVINIFKEASSNKVELLEINVSLKPGDSGGPVLDQQGSLIGLIMGNQKSDPSKSYAIASGRIQQEYLKYRNSILD